ncbi:hypothetical protein CGSMWGv00703Bmash_00255 [Gardnerella pickettii 00703Bmash]|nr:hypothetical protein CGSMWGv00703Bmash_00255 [Gardnerella pickettii 00703Bmash]
MSGSANRSAFARYALSAHASRFALRFKRKGRSSRPRIMQLEIVDSRYALSEKAGRRATRDFALSAHYVILFKLSFVVCLAQ